MALLKRLVPIVIPLLILVGAVAARLDEPRFVLTFRDAVFDTYQRLRPREYKPVPVRIIDIDDESLARFGQWPWPRTRLAEMVERLRDLGAAVIVFDILFSEPDRTSPSQILPLWPEIEELKELLAGLPDHDLVLAEAVGTTNVVTAFALSMGGSTDARPEVKWGVARAGSDPAPFLPLFTGAINSLPEIEAAARGNGAVNFKPDHDGVVRRIPLLLRLGETIYPTLVAEALRVAQGASTYIIKSSGASGTAAFGAETGLSQVKIGKIEIPTDANGGVWLHYTGPVPERRVPAWRLFDGTAPADAIAGHIVLIGSSATALMDLRTTPLAEVTPGVELHAQALEQILLQDWLVRPDWAYGAEVVFAVVLGLMVIFMVATVGGMWAGLVGVLAIGGAFAGSWHMFAEEQELLDPLYPSLTVVVVYFAALVVRYVKTEAEKRFIRRAFSSYVSPNLVEHFIKNPGELRLGGERRECSFVLTDLAGFTTLVEKSDPASLVSLLNDYLNEMTRITFAHEGTLDRIVGDAVAVMFSAPAVQPDHAARAVACALDMDRFAQAFAVTKRAEGVPLGLTRIGVHSGSVIIGNVGGDTHSDYRALGDPINTSARLETVNKHLGTRICVSGATVAQCPDFIGRPVGDLMLVGKSEAIPAFEPLSAADAALPAMTAYANAFALLDSDPPAARAAFADLAEKYPDDPLAAFHHRRLESGETGSTVVMTEK